MATYFNPRQEIHNSSGTPYNGAKAYFYTTGTDDLKDVYTNEGLSIAHANPVVADSAGHWASIYLNTDAAYKVVVKDSDDNTIYTDDPVRPVPLYSTFAALQTHGYRAANSPVRYGALGDGVADESSYVQSAITNATGTVDLLGLTYKCDSQLTVPSNRRIINGVLDFSGCSATDGFIKIAGSLGSTQGMSAVSAYSSSITSTLTPSGVSTNSLIRLQSSDALGSGTGRAEFARVRSVSGTTINLSGLTEELAYTTSAAYAVVTPKERVVLEDLEIRGALSGTRYGVYVSYGDKVAIRNCRFVSINTYAVWLQNAYDVKITDVQAENCAGCVFVDGAEHVVIRGLTYEGNAAGVRVKIGKAAGGVGQGIDIVSNDIRICDSGFHWWSTGTAIAAYLYSRNVVVDNCHIHGQFAPAILISASSRFTVSKCNIAVGTSGQGIEIESSSGQTTKSILLLGNVINAPDNGIGILIDPSAGTLSGIIISDNQIDAAAQGIWVNPSSTPTIKFLRITNNLVMTTGGYAMYIDGSSASIQSVTISGNTTESTDTSNEAIYCIGGTFFVISGNHITKSGTSTMRGIDIFNINYISITDNLIDGDGPYGISYENAAAATVKGVNISGNVTKDGTVGVQVYAGNAAAVIQGITVNGNNVASAGGRGIYLRTIAGGKLYETAVVGNALTLDGTTVDAIDASGGGAGDIDTIAAIGNATHKGRYGASFTNDTNSNHSANVARAAGTGTSNGATEIAGANIP